MNEFGAILLGSVLRGTAFAALGLILVLLLRKRGPAAVSLVMLATLVGMAGVTLFGASSQTRWWSFDAISIAQADSIASHDAKRNLAAQPEIDNQGNKTEDQSAAEPQAAASSPVLPDALRDLARALVQSAAQPQKTGWGWQAWVAILALGGIALGLGRFALGLAAVHLLRKSSGPVADPIIEERVEIIRAEIGLTRAVQVRVSPGLTTPATVGWLRPAILLPPEWTEWDERERDVVLSHELAHIRRNDYISGLLGQLSLALHYYHPLAHWLAGRLRLEQELAADAWGAQLSGGNRTYLTTLARMALRSDPRPAGWPARSFRPGRGTFLRRIEMLRDTTDVKRPTTLPRFLRLATFAMLFVAGAVVVGLRVPGTEPRANAAPPPQAGGAAVAEGAWDSGFIPADTAIIAVARPAELLTKPEIAKFAASIEPLKRIETDMGIKPADLEQVTMLWTFSAPQPEPRLQRPLLGEPAGIIVRFKREIDMKAIITKLSPNVKEATFGDVTYFRPEHAPFAFASPNARTVVAGPEPFLFRMLVAKPGTSDRSLWAPAFNAVKRGQFAVGVDATTVLAQIRAAGPAGEPAAAKLGAFAPLLERATAYAIGVDGSQNLSVDGVVSCVSPDGAQQVADTLKASITLGRNTLTSLRTQTRQMPPQAKLFADLGLPFLEKSTVTVEGSTVHLSATSEFQLAQALQLLTPSVQGARDSARRVQSMNNLKQIGLAFHNYADSNGNFPAAAVLGPDGKTKHSWRVALLPYIDQADLYNQYKLNEPWDSPANLQVLAKMPVVYRHPNSKQATASSYYVLTGKDTIFSGDKGKKLSEITDGTSNTIMAVEADREIPWTKPEDIAFDQAGALPKLGGFEPDSFTALFADGSVRTINNSINAMTLKALLTAAGGEVIKADGY